MWEDVKDMENEVLSVTYVYVEHIIFNFLLLVQYRKCCCHSFGIFGLHVVNELN